MAGKRRTLWAEANDPSTPQERLTRIAKSKKPELLAAIVKNPNTPLPVLLHLMHRDPSGFINNPAVPLHFLESPGLLSSAPLQGLRALANLSDAPDWLFYGFDAIPSPLKITLLSEDRINPKLLFVFAQDHDPDLRGMLTRYNKASAELLALLRPDATTQHKVYIASHPNVSSETLAILAFEESEQIRAAVARNRKTSAALLDELFFAPEDSVRLAVVHNPFFVPSFRPERFRGQPPEVQSALVSHAQSGTILYELSKNPRPEVRLAVAKNQNTNEETLAALALDRVSYVCQGVAQNPNVTPEMLRIIADGEHAEFCRLALASHPRTPIRVLEVLMKDKNTFVREAAIKSLSLSPTK